MDLKTQIGTVRKLKQLNDQQDQQASDALRSPSPQSQLNDR